MGFRRFTEADEAKVAGWLADEVAPVELADERLREALLARSERIEPPSRVNRIIKLDTDGYRPLRHIPATASAVS